MIDGGLGARFRAGIPDAHWQRIETGGTGRGIPDLNGCLGGVEVWVELKLARGWRVSIRPEQVAWIERRARAGGRAFVAVRRGGDLWLLASGAARVLVDRRLDAVPAPLVVYQSASGPWDWEKVRKSLFLKD